MNLIGKYLYSQRAHHSSEIPLRRVPKRPSALCRQSLLASAAFGAVLAGGSAVWASPTLTTLATFDYSNGRNPYAGLIADAAGNLYGTTFGGPNSGTVFQVAAGSHALSTLATFNGSNGAMPYAGLIADAAGNLYGTTQSGGANNAGTVFQVAAGTHALSTLVSFNGSNGAVPYGGLITDAAGNMYGTTSSGGANHYGTVFQLAAGTNALSTIVTFNNSDGAYPYAGLVADAAGNLYGTTGDGGANDRGTVFEVAAGTHALSTLATFNNSNGSHPFGDLIIDGAGNLYGTTNAGGANGGGTVFQVAAGTHALSTLVSFNGSQGYGSFGTLIADAAGNLYGTTSQGGPNGGTDQGTVFEVAAGTNALSTLATFSGGNGAIPYGGLIADAAGNLYGTTVYGGGPDNVGTVYELTNTGFVTSAPEPAAASLIGLAGLGLLARRRRSCRA